MHIDNYVIFIIWNIFDGPVTVESLLASARDQKAHNLTEKGLELAFEEISKTELAAFVNAVDGDVKTYKRSESATLLTFQELFKIYSGELSLGTITALNPEFSSIHTNFYNSEEGKKVFKEKKKQFDR